MQFVVSRTMHRHILCHLEKCTSHCTEKLTVTVPTLRTAVVVHKCH